MLNQLGLPFSHSFETTAGICNDMFRSQNFNAFVHRMNDALSPRSHAALARRLGFDSHQRAVFIQMFSLISRVL